MLRVVQQYFDDAMAGRWLAASNAYEEFRLVADGRGEVVSPDEKREDYYAQRQPLIESFGTWEAYRSWDPKFLRLFGQDIISAVPASAIYFGGTDPGRFLVTAMCESQLEGRPFFTIR
jgi:hypothetical protein